MKKNIEFLNNKIIRERKRENQKNFNYIDNYDKIKEMKFEDIKNIYSNRIEEFEKSSLSYNQEHDLYKFEFLNLKIIIRDNLEKRFFFNQFINEYLDYKNDLEKEEKEKMNFKKFLTDMSNFLIFKEKEYIILDIEKDYINK